MFDIYKLAENPREHCVTVTENRAPTDESIRLAVEMEQKVLNKILSSVYLDGCEVDCVVHRMVDALRLQENFIIEYRLGNQRYRVDYVHKIGYQRTKVEENDKMIRAMVTVLAEDIARRLLADPLSKALNKMVR